MTDMTEDKQPTQEHPTKDTAALKQALGLRPLDEIVATQVVKVRKARQRTPVDAKMIEEANK